MNQHPPESLETRWRDISSAPRDGTAILAKLPDSDWPTVIAYSELHGHWYVKWDGEPFYIFSTPTRWLPLPPPPNSSELG